jgi:hypothetical protein
MLYSIRTISITLCATVLLLAGCAAAPMRPTQFNAAAEPRQAIVTFVRESVWMGDGIHLYLWDGESFIGTLSAGTLVQYRVAPGPHVFMANSENWSYVKADLQPGKHYFIKANMFPGFATARSALTPVPNTDERIKTWPTKLKVVEVVPETKGKYVTEQTSKALTALQGFKDGKVGFAEMTEQHSH